MHTRPRCTRRALLASLAVAPTAAGCLDSGRTGGYGGGGRWPTQGYDAGNTGHNPTATGPGDAAAVRWTLDREVYTSPAVVDETVSLGDEDGTVRALGAEDGDQRWAFETGDAVYSAPAVADGTVYVASSDDSLYALDAETGDEGWRFETDWLVKSAPAVTADTVFVGNRGAELFALDAETGGERWQLAIGDGPESGIDTAVVAAGESLYTASGKVTAVGPE